MKKKLILFFVLFVFISVIFSNEKSNKLLSNTTPSNFSFIDGNNRLYQEIKNDINFDKEERKYIRKYLYPLDANIFDMNEMKKIYIKHRNRANGLLIGGIVSSAVGLLAFVGYCFLSMYTGSYLYYTIMYPIIAFSSAPMVLMVFGSFMLALTTFTILTIPFVFIPLAAIAYWHAGKTKNIIAKINEESVSPKLDKSSFMNNPNNKIDLDMKFKI